MSRGFFLVNVCIGLITISKGLSIVNRIQKSNCTSYPDIPIDGNLSCSSNRNCLASCYHSYRFPLGEKELKIECRGSKWEIMGSNYTYVPKCEPICSPKCQNKGICVAPNQCDCPENFSGPQCQLREQPEKSYTNLPILMSNIKNICNSTKCIMNCVLVLPAFPDGTEVANLICK